MKAKVLKRFKDKHSGEIHNIGDIITISKKRFNEILEVDVLVEQYSPEKEEKTSE